MKNAEFLRIKECFACGGLLAMLELDKSIFQKNPWHDNAVINILNSFQKSMLLKIHCLF